MRAANKRPARATGLESGSQQSGNSTNFWRTSIMVGGNTRAQVTTHTRENIGCLTWRALEDWTKRKWPLWLQNPHFPLGAKEPSHCKRLVLLDWTDNTCNDKSVAHSTLDDRSTSKEHGQYTLKTVDFQAEKLFDRPTHVSFHHHFASRQEKPAKWPLVCEIETKDSASDRHKVHPDALVCSHLKLPFLHSLNWVSFPVGRIFETRVSVKSICLQTRSCFFPCTCDELWIFTKLSSSKHRRQWENCLELGFTKFGSNTDEKTSVAPLMSVTRFWRLRSPNLSCTCFYFSSNRNWVTLWLGKHLVPTFWHFHRHDRKVIFDPILISAGQS